MTSLGWAEFRRLWGADASLLLLSILGVRKFSA